ncbi:MULTISPECIES: hypothetical protein [Streptomyces]|uniref:hypothetical protein n=1 Tax=Streptomyces TaxID=1883 RepID=UPI0004CDD0FD|nr:MULTISPECIES: hypothetical protein [Streptomyces]KOT49939.1 hypothetical protein ADK43_35065 [Streptomyces rimosus subsp. rimosus]
MTDRQNSSADERRERYANAIGDFMARECTICGSEYAAADAVMAIAEEEITEALRISDAVADEEQEELRDAISRVRALAEQWQAAVRPGEHHPAARAVLTVLGDVSA